MARWVWLALLAGMAASGSAWSVEPGDKVEVPTFKDMRYLPRTIADFGAKKFYVLYFFSNTCPVAQRYMGAMAELDNTYRDNDIQFVGVNVSPADNIIDVAQFALEYQVFFPMVNDDTGACAKALGITRTPEVAVLDGDMVLRYRGRVDDQFRLGGVRPEPTRQDLKVTLDQLLAGEAVETPTTVAEGCLITYPALPEPAEPVTFSEDIAPILNQHCLQCHSQNGNAPFSLDNYAKASRRADMIAEVVRDERMPPWYAHPEYGTFTDDRSMPDSDKLLIEQWVAGGAPEGDPSKLPPLPEFPAADEWSINPDVIVKAAMPSALPKTGFIPYRYVLLPYEFEHDTYVEGIEIKSTNPKVIHHANLFYASNSFEFTKSQNFITGTVPGGMPTEVAPGVAIVIPKGSMMGLQIHYVTTGKVELDTPMVGLRFSKNPVKQRTYYNILDARPLKIPPFERAHETVETATIQDDVTLLALFSHMHVRGRDMAFYANYPDGTRETLLSLPNYNFDWQLTYYVNPGDKLLPKGTEVECVAHFDNSPFNPYNPDPTKEVRYGPQTVDEMSQGFIFYVKNDENLNLKVDPNTGYALDEVASAN
ncbi:MAG: redoxin domain-containing protein [Candidatus Hydrogenedens sp.]|nr:redoxin domain-containing protein [Candidatus Hydrogenedens sp.]